MPAEVISDMDLTFEFYTALKWIVFKCLTPIKIFTRMEQGQIT